MNDINFVENWKDLIYYEIPREIEEDLKARKILKRSMFDIVVFDDLNLDEFCVRIDKLPLDEQGQEISPTQLLSIIRKTKLNSVLSKFYPKKEDEKKWLSDDFEGAAIDIKMVDPGVVVASNVSASKWIFSTVFDGKFKKLKDRGEHPVVGNREFGFKTVENTLVFYTKGADKLNSIPLQRLKNFSTRKENHRTPKILNFIASKIIFGPASKNWELLQKTLFDYINKNGGQATILPPIQKVVSWDKVLLLLKEENED